MQDNSQTQLKEAQAEADESKKKRKKRNKKKGDKPVEPPQQEQSKALRDNLPVDELFADSDQSEDEGIADYKIGGYHSVHIGEVLIHRYVIL